VQEFDRLFDVLDRLLAPGGCPWDRKQTMRSLRYAVIEEVYEVAEAIEEADGPKIQEELGDLFFTACFLCRLGEKEGLFSSSDVFTGVAEKLIRRHPHIFGDKSAKDAQEVLKQWEEIKDEENGGSRKENPFEGIPKALPALSKAQKIIKRLHRIGVPLDVEPLHFETEEQCVEALLKVAHGAQEAGMDAEMLLREKLTELQSCDLSVKS